MKTKEKEERAAALKRVNAMVLGPRSKAAPAIRTSLPRSAKDPPAPEPPTPKGPSYIGEKTQDLNRHYTVKERYPFFLLIKKSGFCNEP